MLAVQVVVASKFDNRLKEFGERWEVDRYLSAAGYLSANVRPFFVALPKVSSFLLPLPSFSVHTHAGALTCMLGSHPIARPPA